jgi:hypothetical protein
MSVITVDCISSPFMFARRVIDVRGEVIGQHLFPIDCGSWSRLRKSTLD